MRRNNMGGNRLGGRGGGGHNQNNSNRSLMSSTTGPLMTDHLQLRELDLELALLKRKREIIEEQHSMLVTESRGFPRSNQFGFDQPSQSYGQRMEQNRNFNTNYYNDPPAPRRAFDTKQGVKRAAIDPWDNSASAPAPKRFNGPPRRKPNTGFREQRPTKPQQHQPKLPPLMGSSFPNQKPAGKPRPNFNPNKIGKRPRSASNLKTAPSRLNAFSQSDRKKMINETSDLVSLSKPNVSYVLEADKPVNPKLVGRLELALGNVLREMRDSYGLQKGYIETFQSVACQRSLKQMIRERIRSLMLGKVVGTCAQIVEAYRAEHPKKTDIELLDKVRESNKTPSNIAIKVVHQANPERFFKNNISRLLNYSLGEMFARLQHLYQKVNEKKPIHEVINGMLLDFEKSVDVDKLEILEDCVQPENGTVDEENTEDVNEGDQEMKESAETAKDHASETEETDKPEEQKDVENCDDSKTEPDTTKTTAEDKGELEKTKANEVDQTPEATIRFFTRLMETLLRKQLPQVLPKYKDLIFRILCDDAYKQTEAYIIEQTNFKIQKMAERANKSNSEQNDTSGSKDNKKIFFVRIAGRPGLPKKMQMKAFLEEFHPTLIKKHRNMHNILFVSFDKKENCDNILEKNGTVIGKQKLDIRLSEKGKNKLQIASETQESTNESNNETQDNIETQDSTLNESKDSSVSGATKKDEAVLESLDDQITDLLSSIREEEEKKQETVEEAQPDNEGQGGVDSEANEENGEEENKEQENNDEEMKNEDVNDNEGGTVAENKSAENNDAAAENEGAETAQKAEGSKINPPAKSTPRATRQATSTPSTIRTRRASKLAQNN